MMLMHSEIQNRTCQEGGLMLIRIQMKCAYSVEISIVQPVLHSLGWMRGNEPITLAVHSAQCCISKWPRVQRAATEEHINWHKMAKCEKEDVQTRFCGRIAALEWLFFTCYCGLLSSDP